MTVASPLKPLRNGTAPVVKSHSAFARGTALALAIMVGACANNANVDVALESRAASPQTTLLDLAWAAAARDDHYAAIPMFRRAHRKNSGDAEPLIGLGHSLMAIGYYEEAADVLGKAISKDDGSAGAYQALGQSLLVLGNYEEAAAMLERAATLDGGSATSLSTLGVAQDAAGRHDRAVSTFREGLSRYPGSLDLQSNLGLSLALHGEAGEALDILEMVVRDGRSTARHRQNLALAYALANDTKRAARMASIDLDHQAVLANLGYVDMLRALPHRERMAAMLGGTANPKRTNQGSARRGVLDSDDPWVQATVARLLGDEVSDAMAPAEVAPEQNPVALGGVPPLMDPNGWAVQIAAYRKLEHLAPGWTYLSQKYAHIIGGLEPRRSEVDHPQNEKGPVGFFYRLNAGPLTSREEAEDICAQMKNEGGECWVRAPEPAEGRLPDDPAAEEDFISSADHNAVMNQMAQAIVEETPALTLRPLIDTTISYVQPIELPQVAARDSVAVLSIPEAPLEAPVVAARMDIPLLSVPEAPLEAPVVTARLEVPVLTIPEPPLEAPVVTARSDVPMLSIPERPIEVALDTPIEAPIVSARTFVPIVEAPLVFGKAAEVEESATRPVHVGQNGIVRLNARPNKLSVLSAFEEAEEDLNLSSPATGQENP